MIPGSPMFVGSTGPAEPEPRKAFTPTQRAMVWQRQKGLCGVCTGALGKPFHIDHQQPRWCLGKHIPANFLGMCIPCHAAKTKAEAAVRAHVLAMSDKHFNGRKQSKRPLRSRSTFPAGRSLSSRPFRREAKDA